MSSATFASAIPGENWTGMGGTLSPETTVFKEVKCYKGYEGSNILLIEEILHHTGDVKNRANNGINSQPQLVSRISAITSSTAQGGGGSFKNRKL